MLKEWFRIWVRLDPKVADKFKKSCEENNRNNVQEINYILGKHYKIKAKG